MIIITSGNYGEIVNYGYGKTYVHGNMDLK